MKGHNKGLKFSKEHRLNMSLATKGHKHTKATKEKMREAKLKNPIRFWLGKKRPNLSGNLHPMWKGGLPKCLDCDKLVSSKYSKRCFACLHLKQKGEGHPRWKGGVSEPNRIIRRTKIYLAWRKSIYERDNYTCQWCKKRGGILNADHIKPFAFYSKLRFELSNGLTLCYSCHRWKTKMDMRIYLPNWRKQLAMK